MDPNFYFLKFILISYFILLIARKLRRRYTGRNIQAITLPCFQRCQAIAVRMKFFIFVYLVFLEI